MTTKIRIDAVPCIFPRFVHHLLFPFWLFWAKARMTAFGATIEFALQNKYYLLAASAILYIAKLYNDSRRLKAFEGPWLTQFTDLWFAKAAFGDHQHVVLAEVCKKYGDLQPSAYSTSFPAN